MEASQLIGLDTYNRSIFFMCFNQRAMEARVKALPNHPNAREAGPNRAGVLDRGEKKRW